MNKKNRIFSLLESIKYHSDKNENSIALTTFDKNGIEINLSYKELIERVTKTSVYLKNNSLLKENDICMVMCEDNLIEFIVEILSVIACNAIAIPTKAELFKDKFNTSVYMTRNSKAKLIIANNTAEKMQELIPEIPVIKLPFDEIEKTEFIKNDFIFSGAIENIMMMMYTSGSTKNPKGIPIAEQKLCALMEIYSNGNMRDENSVMLSCLALHHVFALVVLLFTTMWTGGRTILVSLNEFIENPMIWFKCVTKYKVTHTGATNYMVAMLNKMEKNLKQSDYDLSSIKSMIVSTEFVQPKNMQEFFDITKGLGLNEKCFTTSYGLSETAGLITISKHLEKVDLAEHKETYGVFVEEEDKEKKGLIYSVGEALAEYDILIVEPKNKEVLEISRVGEVCISGPSVLNNYFKIESNEEHFIYIDKKRYFRTGDLGFLLESRYSSGKELYICGRSKEILIIKGINYSPHYIESIIKECVPKKISDIIAFSLVNETTEDMYIILAKAVQLSESEKKAIVNDICNVVIRRLGIAIHKIILSNSCDILRTSNGKLKRAEMKTLVSKSQWNGEELSMESTINKDKKIQTALTEFVIKYIYDKVDDLLNTPLIKLGFNSLLIQMLIAQINKDYKLRLPIDILSKYPTIKKLSEHIDESVNNLKKYGHKYE